MLHGKTFNMLKYCEIKLSNKKFKIDLHVLIGAWNALLWNGMGEACTLNKKKKLSRTAKLHRCLGAMLHFRSKRSVECFARCVDSEKDWLLLGRYIRRAPESKINTFTNSPFPLIFYCSYCGNLPSFIEFSTRSPVYFSKKETSIYGQFINWRLSSL